MHVDNVQNQFRESRVFSTNSVGTTACSYANKRGGNLDLNLITYAAINSNLFIGLNTKYKMYRLRHRRGISHCGSAVMSLTNIHEDPV